MVKGVESPQSDADASGAYPLEVRGFKSHPLHSLSSFFYVFRGCLEKFVCGFVCVGACVVVVSRGVGEKD